VSFVVKNYKIMSKKTKAIVYNLIGFAILFIGLRYFVLNYTNLTGIWKPILAAVVASLLAPKFQAVNTRDGEKLFMKVLFVKGVKEI
jgi:membrane protein CcdC involved in cytochrome C biogenesis